MRDERIETTGIVHIGIQAGGRQAGQGWSGGDRHGQELGIPNQTLENWVRLHGKGQHKGAGEKPVSPEQMELARLRAENARLRMERDILGKARANFARVSK